MKKLKGKAFIFGDDIETDEILAPWFLSTDSPKMLARNCMLDIDPEFYLRVNPGDIVVAGKNFGTGSGRLPSVMALKKTGLSCVIASSFGRIFFRNAINAGLPALECPNAFQAINQGDQLEVDLEKALVLNQTKRETYKALPFPALLQKILSSGSLLEAIQQKVLR